MNDWPLIYNSMCYVFSFYNFNHFNHSSAVHTAVVTCQSIIILSIKLRPSHSSVHQNKENERKQENRLEILWLKF